jgi:hypothetical protein
MVSPTLSLTVISLRTTSGGYLSQTDDGIPSTRPSRYPSSLPWPPPWAHGSSSSATKSGQTSTSVTTPYPNGLATSTVSTTPTYLATYKETDPSTTTGAYGGRPTDWDLSRKHANNAPMYAAAAIVPIVVLAIIGVVAFVCLRKRKRRHAEIDAAQIVPEEMKPKPTMQPHIAPPQPAMGVSREYTVTSSHFPPTSTSGYVQPIILGPIGSGSNGTYLTGMDTSDMISVTSNTLRPVDPFADNSSLTEPPPPYRPHSIAPPSFTSNSRHSSLRASAPPATSQTHLMERSPFDDPDDDAVSELSGPTIGRADDALSAVFDISYQRDPVVGRPSL